ncbi:UNVERIFIED_CONTAM: Bifunctional dihydrofolate reductase-thymidylate synthase 1 [Sesamum radiatum]|uniref:Bifunctional dihydrofolate reductase-thymidylate synthase n=1 Tax=Sesamum radiatum TaxID=300843 RepID=A0AAW2SHD1_SESRA
MVGVGVEKLPDWKEFVAFCFKVTLGSFRSNILSSAWGSSLPQSPETSKASTTQRFCRRYLVMGGDAIECFSDVKTSTEPITQKTYQVVVAATPDMGIGKDECCDDGRRTWESIPPQFRPLPGRLNVVLTRSASSDVAAAENVISCGSMSSALKLLAEPPYSLSVEKVFLIGGGQILREALNAVECDAIHITEIKTSVECDTFIPPIDMSVYQPWYSSSPVEENGIQYCFATYVRLRTSTSGPVNSGHELSCNGSISRSKRFKLSDFTYLPKFVFEKHEEFQYLRLVQDIISNGNSKDDRTGTGTLSKFGCQMHFNLRKSFPLLTTKVLIFVGSFALQGFSGEELLRSFCGSSVVPQMLSIGLTDREEGDLGPIYGFQWRHFGARYTNMHADYTGQGFDQLLDVIDKIKNKPDDRRIILSAWNPSDLKLMALPPCHMFAQFYVANGELSCQMYQRSADMGLGVPFNIASYALLTCMIAHVCGLIPSEFVHVIGDAHVYKTHISPLQEQLKKLPRPFPILKINPEKRDIDSFVAADFELRNYEPHQKLEMKMAV